MKINQNIPDYLKPSVNLALNKTNYLNKNISYLRNLIITEWDIKNAGFSVVKFKKLFSDNIIEKLEVLSKNDRNIYIGKMIIRKPEINKEILENLAKARAGFILLNKIEENQILSIKKDALFLINSSISVPIIKKYFEFRQKNVYTSFFYASRIEFYYDSKNDKLDIKGLDDETKSLQSDFFLNDIKKILKNAESLPYDSLLETLKQYRLKYLLRELPIETYRELESGCFRFGDVLIESAPESLKDSIDITWNYKNIFLKLLENLI